LNYARSFKDGLSPNNEEVSALRIHKAEGLDYPAAFVMDTLQGIAPEERGHRRHSAGSSRLLLLIGGFNLGCKQAG